MNILEKIISKKRIKVEQAKKEISLESLMESCGQPLNCTFSRSIMKSGRGIIAELKEASPTAGTLVKDFNLDDLVCKYQTGGACALSILTEEDFFKGHLSRLGQAKKISKLPLLRKDFIFDEYQVYESKANGADAILLITSILDSIEMLKLINLARKIDLEVLVEVHDEDELDRAIYCGAKIIGVNNRNLKTMEVDICSSLELADLIPEGIVKVSESGIKSGKDADLIFSAGFNAILVGESLVKSNNSELQIKKLIEGKE